MGFHIDLQSIKFHFIVMHDSVLLNFPVYPSYFCPTCISVGDLGMQISILLFIFVLMSTLVFNLNEVYKL